MSVTETIYIINFRYHFNINLSDEAVYAKQPTIQINCYFQQLCVYCSVVFLYYIVRY